ILDHRERIGSGVDDAFEEGHAVSALFFLKEHTMVDYARSRPTRAGLTHRRRLQTPDRSSPGSAGIK
ncbi:MAG TPA: hypothetical protein VGA15_05050, partial [Bradyrhizobium sp.]